METLPAMDEATWARVVGLTVPEGLALGAASGRLTSPRRASATSWFGTRSATVSSPAQARSDTALPGLFGRTRVSAPGQKARASFRARPSNTAASAGSRHAAAWMMYGLRGARTGGLKRVAKARSFVESA